METRNAAAKRLFIRFREWWNSTDAPLYLEREDVEKCVLAWADMTGTDLGDHLKEVCDLAVETGLL